MKLVYTNHPKFRTVTLKINKEDYQKLSNDIWAVIKKLPNMYKEYEKQGLSNERYRWDLFFYSESSHNLDHFHKYLNDNQIDAALRHITNKH